MKLTEKKDGLTLIEILIVIGIIGVVLAMGGSLASQFANRRAVDRITTSISSTVQLVRLKAGREGVEHRAVFARCTAWDNANPDCSKCITYVDYSLGDNTLTIMTERGDSNQGSANWCNEATQTIRIQQGITLTGTLPPNPFRYTFNPNGTLGGGAATVNITPAGARERCGRVTVTPFGRISVVQGNWDGANCDPIY